EVTLQSYIFYVDDFEPAAASIAVNAPIAEALDCNLIMIPFPNALVTGNRYRLRFNVSGAGTVADPVLLVGSVDELDANGAWVLFATGQTTHDPNTPVDPALFCTSDPPPAMPPAPIDQPGAMGFSKWLEPTEILDNYYWIGSTTAP
ncbi:MAG: hypothetical protein OET44_19850, partial [Gammaproteobacteria bacterium]|nr:hypothetical protein [Gammaproteobacteria bacterium]